MTTFIATLILAASLPATPPAALDLNTLGMRTMAAGDDRAAVATFERALTLAQREFGPEHPATAMVMRNLALGYSRTGELVRAERLARTAIAVLESRFGATDASLVPGLNVLGETLIYGRRVTEARAVLERAVAIGAAAGPHYGTALQNLGAVCELLGESAAAERYYAAAAEARAGRELARVAR